MTPGEDVICQIECRNTGRMTDNFRRMSEIILVMAPKLGKRKDRRQGTPTSPSATCTLLVIGNSRGNIAHAHTEQTADINSHFHRRCHRKNINAEIVRVLMILKQILKPAFLVPCLLTRDLGSMFYCSQGIGIVK